MAVQKYTEAACLLLLQKKQEELDALGPHRLPQRSDFSDSEVVAIKAFLGPWPRALEKAGLKEPRQDDRLEKNREKRRQARRRRRGKAQEETDG